MKISMFVLACLVFAATAQADQLVYVGRISQPEVSESPWNLDIYLHDTKRGTTRRLTNHYLHDYEPALSRDGKKLAYITEMWRYFPHTHGEAQLALMDIASGTIERVDIGDDHWASDPVFSKDGKTIYFTRAPVPERFPTNRAYQIFSYEIATKTIKQLTDRPYQNHFDLALSPDGKKLAYRHAHNGQQVLKFFNLETNAVEDFEMVEQPFAVFLSEPSWRDNNRLYFKAQYGDRTNPFFDAFFEASVPTRIFERAFLHEKIEDPQEVCWLDANRGFLVARDDVGEGALEVYSFDMRRTAFGLKRITQKDEVANPGNNDIDCLSRR